MRKVKKINGAAAMKAITHRVSNNGKMKNAFPTIICKNFLLIAGYLFSTFSDIKRRVAT
ncbi:MAG: hypothetical protein U9O96_07715 [Candidatus Thermoplasmatota archaeon]|nr:hypothetical protein [Candidatus Thermoplasmatota archaeon]